MPGTTTHNYILYKALSSYAPTLPALKAIKDSHDKACQYAMKNRYSEYRRDVACAPAGVAYIGACGPDLFYIEFGTTGKFIADLMHYNKAGLFTIWALRKLKQDDIADYDPKDKFRRDDLLNQLAYYLGQISHIAADITVHPYVNSIVRAYPEPDNKEVFKNARGWLPKAIWKFHNILEHYQDAYVLYQRFQGMEGFSDKHWENVNVARAGSAYYLKKENKSQWFLLKNSKEFYGFTRTYPDGLERDKYRFFANSNWFLDVAAYYEATIPDKAMMERMQVLVQGGTYGDDGNITAKGLFDAYLDWAIARTHTFWGEVEAYLAAEQDNYDDPSLKEDKKYFPTLRRHWNLDCGLAPGVSDRGSKWALPGRQDNDLVIAGTLSLDSSHDGERPDVLIPTAAWRQG